MSEEFTVRVCRVHHRELHRSEAFERIGVVFIDENGGGPGVRMRERLSHREYFSFKDLSRVAAIQRIAERLTRRWASVTRRPRRAIQAAPEFPSLRSPQLNDRWPSLPEPSKPTICP